MPRLALRDLFWLTLVVGVACAWWVNRKALLRAVDESNENLTTACVFLGESGGFYEEYDGHLILGDRGGTFRIMGSVSEEERERIVSIKYPEYVERAERYQRWDRQRREQEEESRSFFQALLRKHKEKDEAALRDP